MSSIFREFPYNRGMECFGERLRDLRRCMNLTQKNLADILQTNTSSVCEWECGRSQPDLVALAKIANYFDVTADYLLGLEDEFGEKKKIYFGNIK